MNNSRLSLTSKDIDHNNEDTIINNPHSPNEFNSLLNSTETLATRSDLEHSNNQKNKINNSHTNNSNSSNNNNNNNNNNHSQSHQYFVSSSSSLPSSPVSAIQIRRHRTWLNILCLGLFISILTSFSCLLGGDWSKATAKLNLIWVKGNNFSSWNFMENAVSSTENNHNQDKNKIINNNIRLVPVQSVELTFGLMSYSSNSMGKERRYYYANYNTNTHDDEESVNNNIDIGNDNNINNNNKAPTVKPANAHTTSSERNYIVKEYTSNIKNINDDYADEMNSNTRASGVSVKSIRYVGLAIIFLMVLAVFGILMAIILIKFSFPLILTSSNRQRYQYTFMGLIVALISYTACLLLWYILGARFSDSIIQNTAKSMGMIHFGHEYGWCFWLLSSNLVLLTVLSFAIIRIIRPRNKSFDFNYNTNNNINSSNLMSNSILHRSNSLRSTHSNNSNRGASSRAVVQSTRNNHINNNNYNSMGNSYIGNNTNPATTNNNNIYHSVHENHPVGSSSSGDSVGSSTVNKIMNIITSVNGNHPPSEDEILNNNPVRKNSRPIPAIGKAVNYQEHDENTNTISNNPSNNGSTSID